MISAEELRRLVRAAGLMSGHSDVADEWASAILPAPTPSSVLAAVARRKKHSIQGWGVLALDILRGAACALCAEPLSNKAGTSSVKLCRACCDEELRAARAALKEEK